jgi:hypothetical protein
MGPSVLKHMLRLDHLALLLLPLLALVTRSRYQHTTELKEFAESIDAAHCLGMIKQITCAQSQKQINGEAE